MTSKEHAEIWRRAAQVVGGMDTMRAEMNARAQITHSSGGTVIMSRSYGPEEMAANRAYSAAAVVLYKIASEYEAAAAV